MKRFHALILALAFAHIATAQQDILALYDSSRYKAIISIVEESDTNTVYKPLELYRIGRAYFNEDRPIDALIYFDKALAAGRDSATTHFFRGICLKQKNELDAAKHAQTEAIKRDSADQYYWSERGELYYFQNNLDSAIADFEKAVACKKEFATPYFFYFYCHFLKKDYKKGEKIYQEWEKDINADEYYSIASLQILGTKERDYAKNYKKAAQYFEQLIEKSPLSIKNYEDLLMTHTLAEKWKEVDAVFEKLKKRHAEKELNDKDLKRKAAVVERIALNDTTNIIVLRHFKTPTEFADPIYQAYIDDARTDSTVMTILTEKSIDLGEKGADNHMLCGWQGSTHMNFGMITRDGKVKYKEFRERMIEIVSKKVEPDAATSRGK